MAYAKKTAAYEVQLSENEMKVLYFALDNQQDCYNDDCENELGNDLLSTVKECLYPPTNKAKK